MILTDIKQYVQKHKLVSVQDVARHFDVETEAARGMLGFWVTKGKMKKTASTMSCNQSCGCEAQDQAELYEWNSEFSGISIDTR